MPESSLTLTDAQRESLLEMADMLAFLNTAATRFLAFPDEMPPTEQEANGFYRLADRVTTDMRALLEGLPAVPKKATHEDTHP